jgi:DNA invertase Pin-like site-specific DNA recombinase
MMTKAYSYIRLSTPEQQKGRSLERQLELAAEYAEKRGLELDTTTSYHDLGVSGFKGKNRDAALGAFVNAVRKGEVSPGSFLLVESLDRLSREKILVALNQLGEIIDLGITVVTLQDQRVFDKDSLADLGSLIVSLTIMSRANEESENKSRLLRDAWSRKKKEAREGGLKLTSWCPAWLQLSEGRKGFEVIEERAEVVRRIFRMTLDGIGMIRIARQLNEEGVPVFGNSQGWHYSYINKILANEGVTGTFQPMREEKADGKRRRVLDGEPILNYYPAVVDRADFLRIKAMKDQRRKPRGRTGHVFSNLLSGLLKCGICGGSMHYVGKGKPPKGRPYLTCSNARRNHGDCNAPSWRYEPIEAFIVKGVSDVDLSQVFPVRINAARERLVQLGKTRLEMEDEVAIIKRRLENAMIELLDNPSDALRELSRKLEARQLEVSGAFAQIEKEIDGLRMTIKGSDQEKREREELLQRWMEAQTETDTNTLYMLRAKLNQSLRETIHTISVHPDFDMDTGEHVGASLWVSLRGDDRDHVWAIQVWREGRSGFVGQADKVFGPEGSDDEAMRMEWQP